jgi:hypothetical protein
MREFTGANANEKEFPGCASGDGTVGQESTRRLRAKVQMQNHYQQSGNRLS